MLKSQLQLDLRHSAFVAPTVDYGGQLRSIVKTIKGDVFSCLGQLRVRA